MHISIVFCVKGWGIGVRVRVTLNSRRRGGGGTSQHLYHQPTSG